ncbi:PTS system cellobiose-specific IIA component [Gracilibacillus halotolerans]|uniref:PTS system cellobiose-specific IIA component n=1 Tax=Gracilibacillus halotolerans TaxID=74386 RepID=A0A841RRN2_9BACI|nr:PTS system cellobiose-specific IIA component [Gracilibacillus halotolerans]
MKLTKKEVQLLSFQIILHAGNARSLAMEAIKFAKAYHFEKAYVKIAEAKEALIEAHAEQTKLLQEEVNGQAIDHTLILIHAQDHLMNAMTVRDLATEMIEMYERMKKLEAKL